MVIIQKFYLIANTSRDKITVYLKQSFLELFISEF